MPIRYGRLTGAYREPTGRLGRIVENVFIIAFWGTALLVGIIVGGWALLNAIFG